MSRVDLEGARTRYVSCESGIDEWMGFFRTSAGEAAVGKIIYDIWDEVQSIEEYRRGRRRVGRRPRREASSLAEVFATIFPEEYSNEPISVCLPPLMAGRTQREFADEIHLGRSHLSRIVLGQIMPGIGILEDIAGAANVKPAYFVEYRAQYVSELIGDVMMRSPNLSITAVKRLQHLRGGRR